jgi:hypothetical protein
MLPANALLEKQLKLGFLLVYDADLIFKDLKKRPSLETAQQRSRLYDGKKEFYADTRGIFSQVEYYGGSYLW